MFAPKEDRLQALLEPIRKRLFIQTIIRSELICLLGGLSIGGALLIIARFLPLTLYYREISAALLLAALLAGLVHAFMHRPNERTAAAVADRNGLAERVRTALDYSGNASVIARMQREDAIQRLEKALPQVLASIQVWQLGRRDRYVLPGLAVLWMALLLVANPLDEGSRQQALQQEAVNSAAEQLAEAEKQAAENEALNAEQKNKLAEMYEQLKLNLQQAEDPLEQLNALQETEMLMQQLSQQEQARLDALKQMQQALAGQSKLQQALAAMQKMDQEALQQAMAQIAKDVEKLSPEQKQALADQLKAAAEQGQKAAQAANSQEARQMADALQAAAEAMAKGDTAASMEQLQTGLMPVLQQTAQAEAMIAQMAQSRQALGQAQMTLATASQIQGNTVAQAGGAGAGSASAGAGQAGGTASGAGGGSNTGAGGNNNGGSAGANASQGNGAANGNGSGNAGGNGSGNGSGNGGGNGSGNGTGNGSGNGGFGTGGKGAGAGLGDGSHELVTVPSERIDGQGGPVETVGGPLGEGPDETRQSSTTQVSSGVARPYKEVYQQYAQYSRESMERSTIPGDYKAIVKDYFQNIEP